MTECYWNKFHPTEPQCKNEGRWLRPQMINYTDNWTWCDQHACPDNYRRDDCILIDAAIDAARKEAK